MFTFIWRLSGYSTCLRSLDNIIKPVGVYPIGKSAIVMYPRKIGPRGGRPLHDDYRPGIPYPDYGEYDYGDDYGPAPYGEMLWDRARDRISQASRVLHETRLRAAQAEMPYERVMPPLDYEEGYPPDDFGPPVRDNGAGPRHPPRDFVDFGDLRESRKLLSKAPKPQKPRGQPKDFSCGELRLAHEGMYVRLKGRVQYFRLNRFITLRDSHGSTQVVALEERLDLVKRMRNIPVDSHIEIVGVVSRRPTVNTSMATGEVEVQLHDITDVAAAKRKFEAQVEDPVAKKAKSCTLLTSAEVSRCETAGMRKKFQQRTHNCGELSYSHIGKEVSLCGWIESKRGDRFIVFRDGYGVAQIVVNPLEFVTTRVAQNAEPNTLMSVKGTVSLRPTYQRNVRMATGDIEVKVKTLEIIVPNEDDGEEAKDEEEIKKELDASESSDPLAGDVNSYSARTHTCGELRGGDVGREVVLCGWLESQRTNRFGILRDGHGKTQLLVQPGEDSDIGTRLAETPLESVVMVVGTVGARPPEQVTEKIPTGEVEVVMKEYTVLNPARKDMPFIPRDYNKPKENLRMKYRYIDLRYPEMQYRMRLRSRVLMRMREFLINKRGFCEVETPTLFSRTPGGAQEYVVPTRMEDRFYSLVQSPQQLKQMLMVGAMDRYFQVARCYRDEGARPDRQPEFTQMDIELSFTDREHIMKLIEDLLQTSWPENLPAVQTPFPVYTYQQVMQDYGSDKPDLTINKKFVDILSLISEERKLILKKEMNVNNFIAKVLVVGVNNVYKLNEVVNKIKAEQTNKSMRLMTVKLPVNQWEETLTKAFTFLDVDKLKTMLNLEAVIPSTLLVGLGEEETVLPALGKVRNDVFSNATTNFNFAWIVDFPLFNKENGKLESAHHPFTQPNSEDAHMLFSNPLKVRGLHFDLILNGHEVGGGSVRIHDSVIQSAILKNILNIPTEPLQHLIDALKSGAPPHGGIALGIDRLLSVMVGAESIRDVIAFPKGVDGKDPLTGAPSAISNEEKRLYHLLPRIPNYF